MAKEAAEPWKTAQPPFVLLEDSRASKTLLFREPIDLLCARSLAEVDAVLIRMTQAQRAGFHLAGYAAYEAGYAFEPRLETLSQPPRGPLLCFGVFRDPTVFDWRRVSEGGRIRGLEPLWSARDYERRFARIVDRIHAGDVYQANLTFPLHGGWRGDPLSIYAALRRHQPAPFGGVVALGEGIVLSFSPELFFETRGRKIRVRPMKGTSPRGLNPEDDNRLARLLAANSKDRAENLMIVDLMRNDLSRVAELGSVTVTDLFTVEQYPTVLQMTSGVEAHVREDIGLTDLFRSLFPCGSVTGAPKIRAMGIIRELEDSPRGVYCGSIGHVQPNGDARFNVAIRTATLFPEGDFIFQVGSGVVFDSSAQAEYEECLLKARFLKKAAGISV